jgi:hypothetical protein
MKIAVLITGSIRRLDLVLKMMKKYYFPYQDYHLFCSIDCKSKVEESRVTEMLRSVPQMKCLNYYEYNKNSIHIVPDIENRHSLRPYNKYLSSGGSVHQFHQLLQAFKSMENYELANEFRYDYVMRLRTDSTFTMPMDFKWLEWDVNEIEERLQILRKHTDKVFCCFMTTLPFKKELLPHAVTGVRDFNDPVKPKDMSAEEVYDYLHNGRYCNTHRLDVVYFMKRELFTPLPVLLSHGYGSTGQYKYWKWDAEGQFLHSLHMANIDVYTYHSQLEEDALCLQDGVPNQYYESDGSPKDPRMLFAPKYQIP